MWSSWSFGRDDSKRCLVDSWASTMHACFVFGILLDASLFASVSWKLERFFVPFLQGIAASIGSSNFLLAVLMVSLKFTIFWISERNPLSCRASSSFGFSFAHYWFSFFWALFLILTQTSSNKFSCLVVAWITTCNPLEVALSREWTWWILSKNLIPCRRKPLLI